jgi:hypothetical protein
MTRPAGSRQALSGLAYSAARSRDSITDSLASRLLSTDVFLVSHSSRASVVAMAHARGAASATSASRSSRLQGVPALLALLVWVAIRVIGTVPINSATLDWPTDNPPQDWQAQVAGAERFHNVGVWASVVAFGAFTWALIHQ